MLLQQMGLKEVVYGCNGESEKGACSGVIMKFTKRNRMRRHPGELLQHRLLLTAAHWLQRSKWISGPPHRVMREAVNSSKRRKEVSKSAQELERSR